MTLVDDAIDNRVTGWYFNEKHLFQITGEIKSNKLRVILNHSVVLALKSLVRKIRVHKMGRHKNSAQEAIMVKFMQEYTDLACGTLSNKQLRNNLWTLLANKLNSRGPPRKTPERWKKVWFDWRSAVKRKIIHERNEAVAADQDELQIRKTFLSTIENKLANICGFLNNDTHGNKKLVHDNLNIETSILASDGGVETETASVSKLNKSLSTGVNVHANTIKQKDLSKHYSSDTTVIKEELILDETDNEMAKDSDVGIDTFDFGERNTSETECLTVEPFVICHTRLSEVKHELEDSDVSERQLKDRHSINSTEKVKTSNGDLVHLIAQQTTLMQTVSELVKVNAKAQTESLQVMKDIKHDLKEMCEIINKLNEATAENLKEQRRHNYEIEKLRREEMLLQKQQLELNELAIFRKD